MSLRRDLLTRTIVRLSAQKNSQKDEGDSKMDDGDGGVEGEDESEISEED
jgi:hypothetical protein